jgi:hypothetical protein
MRPEATQASCGATVTSSLRSAKLGVRAQTHVIFVCTMSSSLARQAFSSSLRCVAAVHTRYDFLLPTLLVPVHYCAYSYVSACHSFAKTETITTRLLLLLACIITRMYYSLVVVCIRMIVYSYSYELVCG